ncbi:hypothetical protein BDR03DRAFT_974247 [Suillus americanus]|nr:hypothetical protein BDR03DRAFT_974247 [Suillus americanus]
MHLVISNDTETGRLPIASTWHFCLVTAAPTVYHNRAGPRRNNYTHEMTGRPGDRFCIIPQA